MYKYDGNDIMKKLANRGYTSYRIRKDNILPQGTLTKIKNGGNIGNAEHYMLPAKMSNFGHCKHRDNRRGKN